MFAERRTLLFTQGGAAMRGWSESVFIKSSDQSKQLNTRTYTPGKLVPVFSADALLSDKQYQHVLGLFERYCGMSNEYYEAVYKKLIDCFVEYVQVIPSRSESTLCGLMNEGLLRSINALHYYIQEYPDSKPIERYAVFSAGLLCEVSKVVTQQRIFITTKEGEYRSEWHRFSGSLTHHQAEYYKMMIIAPVHQRLSDQFNVILAQQLLPNEAFLWLSQHPDIFADWLDALNPDRLGGMGRFVKTIQLVKNREVEWLLEELLMMPIELLDSSVTNGADQFLEWLKDAIEKGDIKVNTNDGHAHMVNEGVFLGMPIFERYLATASVGNFPIFDQLRKLFGVTTSQERVAYVQNFGAAKSGFSLGGFLGDRQSVGVRGVVLPAEIVFTNGKIPPASTSLKTVAPLESNLPAIILNKPTHRLT